MPIKVTIEVEAGSIADLLPVIGVAVNEIATHAQEVQNGTGGFATSGETDKGKYFVECTGELSPFENKVLNGIRLFNTLKENGILQRIGKDVSNAAKRGAFGKKKGGNK